MVIFWTTLGIIFLYLDLIKKSTLKLTFASTFLFCAIIAHKYPQSYFYQAICFICFGGIFYTMINTSLKKEKQDKAKEKNLDDFIGKKAIVVKDIGKTLSIDGIGYIKYKKALWQAKSINDEEIKSGVKVEIVSKENKVMNVKVIK